MASPPEYVLIYTAAQPSIYAGYADWTSPISGSQLFATISSLMDGYELSTVINTLVNDPATAIRLVQGADYTVLSRAISTIRMTNIRGTQLHLRFYVCAPRGLGVDLNTAGGGGSYPPDTAIESGGTYMEIGNNTITNAKSYLGITPYMIPLFCQQWKILRTWSVKLKPGATYTTHLRCSFQGSTALLSQVNQLYPAIRPSRYLMVKMVSQPTNDATTPDDIWMGSGAMDVFTTKVYSSRAVVNEQPSIKYLGWGSTGAAMRRPWGDPDAVNTTTFGDETYAISKNPNVEQVISGVATGAQAVGSVLAAD